MMAHGGSYGYVTPITGSSTFPDPNYHFLHDELDGLSPNLVISTIADQPLRT